MAYLSLEQFRRSIGYHPFHFWGLENAKVPVTSACNSAVRNYSWQAADAAGRQDILRAIEHAESKIVEYLGYAPMPHFVVETLPYPKFYDFTQWRTGSLGSSGRRVSMELTEAKVRVVGVETRTLQGTVPVVLTDDDGDGINDTFTCSVATAVTDPAELAVYFASADRLDGEGVSEKYRIRPLTISIAAGTATIRGRAWLLVKPILYEGVSNVTGIDPDAPGTYVTQVEVYRRYADTSGDTVDNAQATLLWETIPCEGWWCCGGILQVPPASPLQYDPAAIGMAVSRVGIRDAELGLVTPAISIKNATTGLWSEVNYGWREPDRVIVRYQSGDDLDPTTYELRAHWQILIARMACAELASRICACDVANKEIYQWQFDLSRAAGANDEQYSISSRDLDNPFGTRRGQVYAWREVSRLRIVRSTLV